MHQAATPMNYRHAHPVVCAARKMDTPVANLLLQIVLYFTGWYLVFLYLSELVLIAYKGEI